MTIPKTGMQFWHARVLDENKEPMLYRVTRIARGTVYYRPVDGGGSNSCPVEEFGKWCGGVFTVGG